MNTRINGIKSVLMRLQLLTNAAIKMCMLACSLGL